jgi:hypothetical protein
MGRGNEPVVYGKLSDVLNPNVMKDRADWLKKAYQIGRIPYN